MIVHPVIGVGNGAGWRPKLSYPWVAHGSGVLWLWNILTGEEFQLRPGVRCEAAGWIHPTTLIFYVGEANAEVWSLDITTRRETLIMGGVNISWGDASDGTWATSYAADGSVVINGQPVSLGVGRYIAASGRWVVVRTNAGLAVYRDSLRVSTLPWRTTCVYPSVDGAVAAYGYNGPVCVADLTDLVDGAQTDCSVTDPPAESSPAVCGEWLWTVAEHGGGCALGRPIGEQACLVLPADTPIDVAAQLVDGRWIVVTQAGAEPKTLTAQSLAADAPRVLLPKAPEPPKPLPPLVRLDLSATSGPVPLTVEATLATLSGSGPINAIRYRKDNIDDGGQDAPTHTFRFEMPRAASVYARAAGPGGVTDTPFQIVTALPPKPVSAFTLGLCAGFGEPLPDDRLAGFVERGVQVVRTWIGTAANTPIVVAQLAKFPALTPLYVVRAMLDSRQTLDELFRVPTGALVEIGNEPNIGDGPAAAPKMTPAQYAALADDLWPVVQERRLTASWGCPSSIDAAGRAWLRDVLARCPWMARVSVHHYGDGTNPGLTPALLAALKAVIGTRLFAVTEFGCKCGPRAYKVPGGFLKGPKFGSISEQQQLDTLRDETDTWRAAGATLACVYQENSAGQNEYGLNAPDGTPRKAWGIFQE